MGEIGVIVAVMVVAGMDARLVMRRNGPLEPGEIERRRDGQQQDQAQAQPLPRRASPELPNPIHGRSLGAARRFRHP